MSDAAGSACWVVGSVEIQRVPYFDVGLAPESIDLEGVAASIDWADPWITGDLPTVGQAFWLVRSADQTIVVDPCGASDPFIRSGPEAVDHQNAAFALLRATGCDPETVDRVVLTHLDGIGMTALADGAGAGEETWTPAFPNADVLIARDEYDFIVGADGDEVVGTAAFNALDAHGVVRAVDPPHEIAPGVRVVATGCHSPGHCRVEIESAGDRAVMIGHLAISPLHAAVGVSANHNDPEGAWLALRDVLDRAGRDGDLVMGSLWPEPGAARVTSVEPYVLSPAAP